MTDPVVRDRVHGDEVRESFLRQSRACAALGSPFTSGLCALLAERMAPTTAVEGAVLSWPGDPIPDALALRLTGALHALVLSDIDAGLARLYPPAAPSPDALWDAVRAALAAHEARILGTLASPPQTNEVARSGILLPGLLAIGRATGLPLALAEIGASGGLNLSPDHFYYTYGGVSWGRADAQVHLTPELRGRVPDLGGDLAIAARRGCDRAPIDVTNEAGRTRLLSYIWADQTERLARCRAAIAIARTESIVVERRDAADFVEEILAAPGEEQATVLFHTVVWQYLPQATQERIGVALAASGAQRTRRNPLAWLRFEGEGGRTPALLTLTLWPRGEIRVLAEADFHGRWIHWRGP